MEPSQGAQPDLRSVLDALWRRRWLFLGILVHATDGLQRAVVDLWPRWHRHAVALRAAGGFVTMAVWVPAALIMVWPSIRWWWVR